MSYTLLRKRMTGSNTMVEIPCDFDDRTDPMVATAWLESRIITGTDIATSGAWIEWSERNRFVWKGGRIIGSIGIWTGTKVSENISCLWENGIWAGGPNTSWVSGIWVDGIWKDGIWADHASHQGGCIWHSGKFLGGSMGRPGAQGFQGMKNLPGGEFYGKNRPVVLDVEFGTEAKIHGFAPDMIEDDAMLDNLLICRMKVPNTRDWASVARRATAGEAQTVAFNGEKIWLKMGDQYLSIDHQGEPSRVIRQFQRLFYHK